VRPAAQIGAACLMGAWLMSSAAHADPPPGHRISAAFDIEASLDNNDPTQVSVGGAPPVGARLLLRYEQPFSDRFALAAIGSFSAWGDRAARDAGYRSARVDVGVAPMWRLLRWPIAEILGELYLAMPVGVSIPIVSPPDRRAFSEHIDDRTGWFVGGRVGNAFIVRHGGIFFECGYQRSAAGIRSLITPHDGSPAIKQQTDYVDHQLIFTVGGLFAF